jgi:hypothetical protein
MTAGVRLATTSTNVTGVVTNSEDSVDTLTGTSRNGNNTERFGYSM